MKGQSEKTEYRENATQLSLLESNENTLLNTVEASEILGVSTATIRNWVRTGQVSHVLRGNEKGRYFDRQQIEKLKTDIQSGGASRLNNRANKRSSSSTFIPIEQLSNKSLLPLLQSYIQVVNEHKLPLQTALLIHSLSVLKNAGLATYSRSIARVNEIKFRNENVKKVLLDWDNQLGGTNLANFPELIRLDNTFSRDSLGVLYQSMIAEGQKAQGGSYYTPRTLIESIVEELSDQIDPGSKVLDLCCGTGQFLVAFAKHIPNPLMLWGYDIDPIAVQIAKINLLACYPEIDFYPQISVADSLIDNLDDKFDVIATNPPWGYHYSKDETRNLKKVYSGITSNEAFSYFLVRGLHLLNENGLLCYVLPEAITKVKQHRDIREFLLRNSSITSVKHLGNVFSKVLSPVITLTIEKRISDKNEVEVIRADKSKIKIGQDRFLKNPEYTFDTSVTNEDEQLIAKIYAHCSVTLKDHADWALGIVTGNNKKFVSTRKTGSAEEVLKGADIQKYKFKPASSFINFTPDEFQQAAPESKYRAEEKLIYRFISSELIFAYDDKKTLTLNSANILIPKIPDIPAKVVLAFLNSNVFQYLYKKRFNTIKVLRGDLEQMPFPQLEDNRVAEIESLVDRLLSPDTVQDKGVNEIDNELNEVVYNAFELTAVEKQYIENFVRK